MGQSWWIFELHALVFARWLGEHLGVEVVSRDRGGEYAEAARRTAPEAADRKQIVARERTLARPAVVYSTLQR